MTIENPNLLERIKKIEKRLDELENRLSSLEKILNRRPLRPFPRPSPDRPSPPGPPGKPPEPFRFKED